MGLSGRTRIHLHRNVCQMSPLHGCRGGQLPLLCFRQKHTHLMVTLRLRPVSCMSISPCKNRALLQLNDKVILVILTIFVDFAYSS